MKLGIITDIHGNIEAFNKVLKKIECEDVNKIICLGDAVGGGAKSEQVMQKIINLKDKIIFVQGNHEGYILNGLPEFVHDDKRKTSETEKNRVNFERQRLSESTINFIKNQTKEKTLNIENTKIFITHYPRKKDGSFKHFYKKPTAKECQQIFDEPDADIYLYGHTHTINYQENDGKMYINPGALGCPIDTKNAPFGILEIEKNNIKYNQFYVDYDINKAVEEIKETQSPGYTTTLKIFYGI